MARPEGCTTREAIIDAVMQLMQEKLYMEITVTDVVKRAGVARASFYRNFSTISDVLDALVEKMSDELISEIFPTLRSTDERKWREYLFHHFYRFSRNHQKIPPVRSENRSVLFTRIDRRMQEKDANTAGDTVRDRYIVAGKMGLINNITRRWIDRGMQESPEELIDFIMSFIMTF